MTEPTAPVAKALERNDRRMAIAFGVLVLLVVIAVLIAAWVSIVALNARNDTVKREARRSAVLTATIAEQRGAIERNTQEIAALKTANAAVSEQIRRQTGEEPIVAPASGAQPAPAPGQNPQAQTTPTPTQPSQPTTPTAPVPRSLIERTADLVRNLLP